MIELLKSLCLCALIATTVFSRFSASAIQDSKNHNQLLRGLTGPCKDTKDCGAIENAECSTKEKSCVCGRGYVADGSLTRCLREATRYGDACEESVQCSRFLSAGGVCAGGEACACLAGYHYLHGRCYLTKGLNEACLSDDDCYVGADHQAAACVKKVCKCSAGYYEREFTTCRRLAKKIGDYCALDSDCQAIRSGTMIAECYGSMVQTKVCKFPERNETKVSLVKSLRLTSRAESISFLLERKPQAAAAAIQVGGACKSDADCKSVKNSICGPHNECICKRAHYARKPSECIPEIGERCEAGVELPQGWICAGDVVSCESIRVTVESNVQCAKEVEDPTSQTCATRAQCRIFGPNSDCLADAKRKKRCSCVAGTRYLAEKKFCGSVRRLGEQCEADEDCQRDGTALKSVCRANAAASGDKVCSCPDKTHANEAGEFCLGDVPELGSYCESSEDCEMPDSACEESECRCKENYFPDSGGVCVAGLNGECASDEDCAIGNSTCVQPSPEFPMKMCQCVESFLESPRGECVPVSAHRQSCAYDMQCEAADSNLRCGKSAEARGAAKESVCTCRDGYYFNEFTCFRKKWIGDECGRHSECLASNPDALVFCRNGVCSCDYGWRQDGRYCKENDASSIRSRWLPLTLLALLLKALR